MLLLYEWSVGQGIRSILIVSSGSGVWAGCASEREEANKHYAHGEQKTFKSTSPFD